MSTPLAVIEDIIDASGVAPQIEVLLPIGVRHRQLTVRTLLAGMMLTADDDRPAHLTRVRQALASLPAEDQKRLRVTGDWRNGPHQLTCRQAERTFGLVAKAPGKDQPDGAPSDVLARTCDDLLEASIPAEHKDASSALATDWTDVESWSRPPRHGTARQNARTPRRPGGTATPACPAPRASCSSAITCPRRPRPARRTARPCPSWPAG